MKLAVKLDAVFSRISNNIIVKSIRRGLLLIMPLIMVGAFVLMALNLPIDAVNDFLHSVFGDHWRTVGLAIHKGTYRIISLAILLSVSYSFAQESKRMKEAAGNPFFVMLTALSCFVAFEFNMDVVLDESVTGTTGMFGAIVIALLSSAVFIFLSTSFHSRRKEYAYDADAILLSSLSNIIPMLVTVFLFALARVLLEQIGFQDGLAMLEDGLNNFVAFDGGGIWTAILYVLITHVLWFFGIHGTNVFEQLAQNLFSSATETNTMAVSAGAMPTEILTKEFFDLFVFIGGAGCTIGLLIALFIAGINSNANRLAKYSILPGLFNINEPMIYGLPIIFNPYYLVPFMLTPIILSITSYAAFATGLVPLTTSEVVWTTPIFISGYASTGSAAGVILQIFNLAISVLIYLPFVRLSEKQVARNNLRIFNQFSQEYTKLEIETTRRMLNRRDEFGMIARSLATEIRAALEGTDDTSKLEALPKMHLEYQPKTRGDGRVFGAEALLRWEHPAYGKISPLIALGLADEVGLTNLLGAWVISTAFAQQKQWEEQGIQVLLSVNIMPQQMKEDGQLVERIQQAIEKNGLDPSRMEIELTEHSAFDQSASTRNRLEQIKDLGVNISIDDFGMGSSSILYLRDFYANVVKLDISLVHSVIDNMHTEEIVRSIISLCRQLDAEVVAEGVETKEQLQKLRELGCDQFQGWYFSKSLPSEDFVAYVKEHGVAPRQDLKEGVPALEELEKDSGSTIE